VTAAPKQSWLKKFGHIIGKILGFAANNAKPVADAAAEVATILMAAIRARDRFRRRTGYAHCGTREPYQKRAVAASIATATTGQQKLDAVTAQIGPEIDAWIAANFPGASQGQRTRTCWAG